MTPPRDYARLHFDWYRDTVLEVLADEEPATMVVWPILIAMAKEASHATDNPTGIIEVGVGVVARAARVETAAAARAIDLLAEGEMVIVRAGDRRGLSVIELVNFGAWQTPRSGGAAREQRRRDANPVSREKAVSRDGSVTGALRPVRRETETEDEQLSSSLRSLSSVDGVAAPPPAELKAPKDPDKIADRKTVDRCFEAYCDLWGKRGAQSLTFTSTRRRSIERAIRKHGKAKVWRSIQGHHANEWRHGDLDRHDIAVLLREENIERGLRLVSAPAASAVDTVAAMGYGS